MLTGSWHVCASSSHDGSKYHLNACGLFDGSTGKDGAGAVISNRRCPDGNMQLLPPGAGTSSHAASSKLQLSFPDFRIE